MDHVTTQNTHLLFGLFDARSDLRLGCKRLIFARIDLIYPQDREEGLAIEFPIAFSHRRHDYHETAFWAG